MAVNQRRKLSRSSKVRSSAKSGNPSLSESPGLGSELRTGMTAAGLPGRVSACCFERVRLQAKAAIKTTPLAMIADRFDGARIWKGTRITAYYDGETDSI